MWAGHAYRRRGRLGGSCHTYFYPDPLPWLSLPWVGGGEVGTMPGHVKMATCSGCEFMVRSASEDEIVKMVQMHAKDTHQMNMGHGDVMKMMMPAKM